MGTFTYPIQLGDPEGQRFERLEALVDTGASFTMAPARFLRDLGIVPFRRAEFELADGRVEEMDVGQTWISVDGQRVVTLVIFGAENGGAVLGATTLQQLLVAVDPVADRLVPTRGVLKGMPCTSYHETHEHVLLPD